MFLTTAKAELNKSITFSEATLIIFSDTLLFSKDNATTQPTKLAKENERV
jgi:hypothetical protein